MNSHDVRPCAWRWGAKKLRGVEWRYTTSQTRPEAEPLFAKDALDAALNLWPRDCRLCAHFTTQTGGCTSTMQCVDSMQFKATTPRQYWIAGHSVEAKAQSPEYRRLRP